MNVLDEYDKGQPERDARRLSVRWKVVDHNVMTDDGPEEMALHIATFSSHDVAARVAELHNRTRYDGKPSDGWADRAWMVETTNRDTANEVHEVMTTSTQSHIGYIRAGDIAHHIAEIHNRTLGDGQDPPPRTVPHGELTIPGRPGESRWAKELRRALDNAAQDIAENTPGGNGAYDYLDGNRPAMVVADDIRTAYLAGYQRAQRDAQERQDIRRKAFEEAHAALPRLNAVQEEHTKDGTPLNPRRPYLADDMLRRPVRTPTSGTLARIDIAQRLEQLISDVVHQRVTEYAAREPAKIVIDGNPTAMANMLIKLGYTVFKDGTDPALQELVKQKAIEFLGRQPVVVHSDSEAWRMADVLAKLGWKVEPPEDAT